MPASSGRRDGIFVELVTNDGMIARFSSNYGGILTSLQRGPGEQNVISGYAGEAFQSTADGGQDFTQGTCNGNLIYPANPASVLSDGYFASEIALVQQGGEWHYITAGPVPFFWPSVEAADDVIPPVPQGDHGWSTRYHNFLNLPAAVYDGPDTPVFFAPRAGRGSGILLVGNEITNLYSPATPWPQRAAQIPNGAVAFRGAISMQGTDAGALAGLIFKKDISALNNNSTIDDFYVQPGYHLYINTVGGAEIRRLPDNALMWAAPATLANQIRTVTGTGLTIWLLSSKEAPEVVEVYFNSVLAGKAYLPDYHGTAFGLFGSCSSGKIRYGFREVFDIQSSFKSYYSTRPDGKIRARLEYQRKTNIPGEQLPLYRLNMPVAFLTGTVAQDFKAWKNDVQLTDNELAALKVANSGTVPLNKINAMYSGTADGLNGVYMKIIETLVTRFSDGSPTPLNAHALLEPRTMAINTLGYENNFAPVPVIASRVVMDFATKKK